MKNHAKIGDIVELENGLKLKLILSPEYEDEFQTVDIYTSEIITNSYSIKKDLKDFYVGAYHYGEEFQNKYKIISITPIIDNNKGLTYAELTELLQYIEQNHSWKNMYENYCNNKDNPPKSIKYVNFSIDTRTCDIWSVTFSGISDCIENEVTFRTEMGYNLKDKIYSWLRGE